ncbi:MAG: RNA methyltransferase [Spirochaetaceae bacterium]|jgi:TrmH RNA methyltransferase|nr:RNA methyltransferase [Spirochaetaceae bacterium]
MFNRLTKELAVCSLNTVRSIVDNKPDVINRLFLRKDRMLEFSYICSSLAKRKRPYKICEDIELERICKTPHHQGIVAMITEPCIQPLAGEDLLIWSKEGLTGIVLHDVGNDFNLGAIIRQAAFFDVRFVIVSERDDAARLTTAAYRAAEGGMMFVTVRSVRRTESFLRDAAEALLVIGADHRSRRRVRDVQFCIEEKTKELGRRPGVALVLGNEECGLPPEVKNCCPVLLRVPGTGNVESLNISQAAALFCHEIFES